MRTVSSLLVVAALAAACGKRASPPPKGPVLEFRLDYAAARRDGLVRGATTNTELQEQTVALLSRRIRAVAGPASIVEPKGTDHVLVRLEGPVSRDAMEELTDRGDLAFRILVDPEPRRDDQAKAPWDGTVEEWRTYREKEVAEWKKARDSGVAYRPTTNPKYRVVRRAEAETETPEDFAVLLEPQAGERFGGEILTNVRPTVDASGMPAVSFDVKEAYRKPFGDWTGRNLGQPVAIVLSQELFQAPVLRSRLTDSVVISLGGADLDEAGRARLRARQKSLVAVLVLGDLPVPLVPVMPPAEAGTTPR